MTNSGWFNVNFFGAPAPSICCRKGDLTRRPTRTTATLVSMVASGGGSFAQCDVPELLNSTPRYFLPGQNANGFRAGPELALEVAVNPEVVGEGARRLCPIRPRTPLGLQNFSVSATQTPKPAVPAPPTTWGCTAEVGAPSRKPVLVDGGCRAR